MKKTAGRPKGNTKEQNLAKLMPAARKLFAEKGYAQTTFKDVAKSIGMTHAALYSYFPSKQELYFAVIEHTQQILYPRYLEAIASANTLRGRFIGVLKASAEEHDKDATITGLLAAIPIEMRRHPELTERFLQSDNAIFSALADLFDQAVKDGEMRKGFKSEQLISALLGGGVGVALFHYGMQGSSLEKTMEAYIALLEGSLFS